MAKIRRNLPMWEWLQGQAALLWDRRGHRDSPSSGRALRRGDLGPEGASKGTSFGLSSMSCSIYPRSTRHSRCASTSLRQTWIALSPRYKQRTPTSSTSAQASGSCSRHRDRRAALARAVIALRDQGQLRPQLAAIAVLELDGKESTLFLSSVAESLAVLAGDRSTPAGLLVATR